MNIVIRNMYTPKTKDYCNTIVVDNRQNKRWIFDCNGVFVDISGGSGGAGVVDVLLNGDTVVDADRVAELTLYTNEQIDELLNQINTAEFVGPYPTVADIPEPYDTNDLYLVGNAAPYQIFVYIESRDELINIGGTNVDFSEYRTAADQDVIDATKQPRLTAGAGIDITGNVISSTGVVIPVQTIGDSTTDVMSQDATTKMVFPNLAGQPNRVQVGSNAVNGHNYSVAVGRGSSAMGEGAIAIGAFNVKAGGGSGIAIGYNTDAQGSMTVSIGNGSTARANGSVVIGQTSSSSIDAIQSTTIGYSAYCASQYGTVLGRNARVDIDNDHSVAIGSHSKTTRPFAVSFGMADSTTPTTVPVSRILENVTDPELPQDAATKAYVDSHAGGSLAKYEMILDTQLNGSAISFTLSEEVTNYTVFYNGVKLRENIGYNIVGLTLNLNISHAPLAGETLDIEYWK